MAPEVLKTVGQVAGIGGVALGVFLLLYRDVIRLKIFPKLTTDQAFMVIVLLLVLVWSVAISGLGVWAWVMTMERRSHAKNSEEVTLAEESSESPSDVANEDTLSIQREEGKGIRNSSPSQAPKRGLSFSSAGGEEWKDDVDARLRGTIRLQSGVTLEFNNLKTARPTYIGDRRTSPVEFSVSRRVGDRMELTSVDLTRVKSLLFLEPEELPGGRYQTSGSYLKIKITYQDGQSETTHCGRFGKLYYSPSGKPEEFKVDFIEIREVVFL